MSRAARTPATDAESAASARTPPPAPSRIPEGEIVPPAARIVTDEAATCPHCGERFRFVQVQELAGTSGPSVRVMPPVDRDPSGSLR